MKPDRSTVIVTEATDKLVHVTIMKLTTFDTYWVRGCRTSVRSLIYIAPVLSVIKSIRGSSTGSNNAEAGFG